MTDLALPGTLPELLRRGAPVVYRRPAHDPGWCLLPDGTQLLVVGTELRGETGVQWAQVTEGAHEWRPVSDLHLDLSVPEGVDRAARWLAAQYGRDDLLSAAWLRVEGGWDLLCVRRGRGHWTLHFRAEGGDEWDTIVVDSLIDISLEHHSADVRALIATCWHAAGITP